MFNIYYSYTQFIFAFDRNLVFEVIISFKIYNLLTKALSLANKTQIVFFFFSCPTKATHYKWTLFNIKLF